jgi:hypothetical protein
MNAFSWKWVLPTGWPSPVASLWSVTTAILISTGHRLEITRYSCCVTNGFLQHVKGLARATGSTASTSRLVWGRNMALSWQRGACRSTSCSLSGRARVV